VRSERGRNLDLGYQPALDGVRAVAVLAVMVFHGQPRWLPGGFLGVDAFFVLSGFLITALLLAERERSGRIALSAFWVRRARRLLPALMLLVVALAFASRWLVPPEELATLRTDALATLAYLANWRMIYRGSDYFTTTAAASPLQHAWSLGIEEQFYLLWPLIVVVATRLRRPRLAIGVLAGAGALASAVVAAMLFQPGNPDRAYFGTDSRASALLVGCALAAAMPLVRRMPRQAGAGLALIATGPLLVGWALASGTSGWLYRGGLLGLALAVAAVLAHLVAAPDGRAARGLSLAPVAWLGRVSYGVYLWHWPLFGLLNGDRTGLTGVGLLAVRILATLTVATFSFYLLELPVQQAKGRSWTFGVPVSATAMAAVFAATLFIPQLGRLPADSAAAASTSSIPPAVAEPANPLPQVVGPPPIARPDRRPGPPRIGIFGDSVAWSLGTYLPADPGVQVLTRAVQGCGIARLPDIRYIGTPHTNYPGCTAWDQRWRGDVDRDDPDVAVILLDRWELMDRRLNGRYQHVGEPEYDAYLSSELELALNIVGSHGARVVLLTAPYTRRQERPDGGLYPEDTPERVDAWNRLLADVAARHPTKPVILDLQKVVCPDGRFTWTVGAVRVRSDGLHFTPDGVKRVIAPWLLPKFNELATM
jgi:peptidoglycan/LPS O-acetylase OafA/YrhL